jgi:hypothetical protein
MMMTMKRSHRNRTMSNTEVVDISRKVSIYTENTAAREFPLKLTPVPKNIRVQRALKSLGIFWAAMVLGAFVPMLHFILVPGFFLAGLFFAANSYYDDVEVSRDPIPCVKCGQPLKLDNYGDHFPKSAHCSSCGADCRIELIK